MNITIKPGLLAGTVPAVASKSMAHRALILAAFAKNKTMLHIAQVNADIEATVRCLNELGAEITHFPWGYEVMPVKNLPKSATLPVGESGSTLRFLLPVVGALGIDANFSMEGRLPSRPLSPLWEEMERMGCRLSRDGSVLHLSGKLRNGTFHISGDVSSQYISGLLLANAIRGNIYAEVTGKLESKPYVDMTKAAIRLFHSHPEEIHIEGDWSNAAFFLTANALGSRIAVTGLNAKSPQGDKAIEDCLLKLDNHCSICAADIPDLIPVLSVAAACKQGAVFTDVRRLRLKESDRIDTIIQMITALGGRAEATENTLSIIGTGLVGGCVDSYNDHRIAMAAAIAATACREKVTIINAQAVNKSYPHFWEDYRSLGGNYEQYLR